MKTFTESQVIAFFFARHVARVARVARAVDSLSAHLLLHN